MSGNPAKARLIELEDDMSGKKSGGKDIAVQFNPETLKLQYANQIKDNSSGGGDQAQGTSGRQFVGSGTTKLSVQLWFDATTPDAGGAVDDVRRMTEEVLFFIQPRETPQGSGKWLPPKVRFLWGSLLFDGLVDSVEETLEYFSSEGKPLRSSIAIGLSQQKILKTKFEDSGRASAQGNGPKTGFQTPMGVGDTLQSAAQAAGLDWTEVAKANDIDNPRFPGAGSLVDLASTLAGRR